MWERLGRKSVTERDREEECMREKKSEWETDRERQTDRETERKSIYIYIFGRKRYTRETDYA